MILTCILVETFQKKCILQISVNLLNVSQIECQWKICIYFFMLYCKLMSVA
jgi:hypothetical protein